MEDNYYSTSDFALVTFLTLEYDVVKMELVNDQTVYFYFEKTDELIEKANKAKKGEACPELYRIIGQSKRVKDMIWSAKNSRDLKS